METLDNNRISSGNAKTLFTHDSEASLQFWGTSFDALAQTCEPPLYAVNYDLMGNIISVAKGYEYLLPQK